MIARLQHLALKTNNLEATYVFYTELLRLPGRCDAKSGHLWVNFDDGFMLRFDRSEDVPNTGAVQYLGLELASFGAVDKMYEHVANYAPTGRDLRETYRHAQGPYGFFIADPNGYLIKVFRYNTLT